MSDPELHAGAGAPANRWPINLTIALAVAVLVIPVLADLAIDDRRVFGYLAPDVFYYLTIARNAHEVGLAKT